LAADGRAARAHCREGFRPQVILSDYHLDEGETGVAVIHMLRLEFGRIPAVVISADRQPELQAQLHSLQLSYLSKPVKPLKLRALLQHLVA
ncbi:response regulator, partial [Streptomyces malaysiensis]